MNKKTLIIGGVVVVGVLIFKPGWAAAALPLVFLAACPLMMFFMMRGMRGQNGASSGHGASGHGGGMSRESAGATPTEADLSKQISSLQDELRTLKAAQAKRGANAERSLPSVDLTKINQDTASADG